MTVSARVTSSLQVRIGGLTYRSLPNHFDTDVEGGYGPTPGNVTATTAGVDVPLTNLVALGGPVRLINRDAANYVTYGIWTGSTLLQLGELLPGENYVLRLSRGLGDGAGNKLRLKANTASCECCVEAFVPLGGTPAAWTPASLPGLKVWLQSKTGLIQTSAGSTPAAANNDPVGKWTDQSGNNNHFLQATTGDRPKLVISGSQWQVTGGAVSTTRLDCTLAAATGTTVWMYVAGKMMGSPSSFFDGIAGNRVLIYNVATNGVYNVFSNGNYASSAFNSGAVQVVGLTYGGAAKRLRVNGSEETPSNTLAGTLTDLCLLNDKDNARTNTGWIGEFILCNQDLSAGDLTNLETYLAPWLTGGMP